MGGKRAVKLSLLFFAATVGMDLPSHCVFHSCLLQGFVYFMHALKTTRAPADDV